MPTFNDLATVTVSRARFWRRPSSWPLAVFVVLVAATGVFVLLPQAHAQTPDTGAFVTTWNTTGVSGSPIYSIADVRFHIGVASGGQVTIDWGDGSTPRSYNASGPVDHLYVYDGPPAPRNATVSISGNLTQFYFHYYS